MRKVDLRKHYQEKRSLLKEESWEKRSHMICHQLMDLCSEFKGIKTVFLYYSFQKEVPVEQLFMQWKDKYAIALPKVLSDEDMEFYQWSEEEELVESSFKIKEPSSNAQRMIPTHETLIIVPNLALDHRGYRLGFGLGYYDRYLGKYPQARTVGVNFSEFISEELPHEEWDVKVDWICTEEKYWKVS